MSANSEDKANEKSGVNSTNSTNNTALQLRDAVILLLEDAFAGVLQQAHEKMGQSSCGWLASREKDFMLADVPGLADEIGIRFLAKTAKEGEKENFWLDFEFGHAGVAAVRISQAVYIPQALCQNLTKKQDDELIIPAIKQFLQAKINEAPYGGVLSYQAIAHIESIANNFGVAYHTSPAPKRQELWRQKLAAYIKSEGYKNISKATQDRFTITEPWFMVDEIGLEGIEAFFLHLKQISPSSFRKLYGLEGLWENAALTYKIYAEKQNPTAKETEDFYRLTMLAAQLMTEGAPDYLLPAINLVLKNGYKPQTPYLQNIGDALKLMQAKTEEWAKGLPQPEKPLRKITIRLTQPAAGPVQFAFNSGTSETEMQGDANLSFFMGKECWQPDAVAQLTQWFQAFIQKNKGLFMPRLLVVLQLDIAQEHASFNIDAVAQPGYQQWLDARVQLLKEKKFAQAGFPFITEDVYDLTPVLERTDFVAEYLAAFEKYAKANKLNIKSDNIHCGLAHFFEGLLKEEELGDMQAQNAHATLANFMQRFGASHRVKYGIKYMKRLYNTGHPLALEYMKDYKPWQDADYWDGSFDPADVAESCTRRP